MNKKVAITASLVATLVLGVVASVPSVIGTHPEDATHKGVLYQPQLGICVDNPNPNKPNLCTAVIDMDKDGKCNIPPDREIKLFPSEVVKLPVCP